MSSRRPEFVGTARECIAWLAESGGDGRYEVAPVRKRRSLTQNAYYWELLNRLARALRMPDSEVHMNMLREYGVCQAFTVVSEALEAGYFRYYDVLQEYVDDAGRRRAMVRVYLGSSRMDSAQFSALLNGLIEECQAQGIQTMTPRELAGLRYVGRE